MKWRRLNDIAEAPDMTIRRIARYVSI